ncbi:5'-nucleotidase [Paragonimus westermani]|uniref:5'-nucleotidase n=1 Tax=Paragonimus westermani TaxID=34504 RepID=A0A5J4NHH2_9TREM|nr:5'-nucleotidase [Paragonimus westermani]
MANQNNPHIVSLDILHFNDVYNVEGRTTEPVGGAARFYTALKEHGAGETAVVLFSGDALSPSMLSTVTQGRHMPTVLNALLVDCAVLGNHDLDFGLDLMYECIEKSRFPWLNTNVFDMDTNKPLSGAPDHHIVEHGGLTIGLIGLLEEEWITTLSCIDHTALDVHDMCEVGRRWARELKEPGPNGRAACDLVIALTHMRWPNDRKLSAEVPEIDLILGGHDHKYEVEWPGEADRQIVPKKNTRAIIKSGTDFENFSHIRIKFDKKQRRISELKIEKVVVDSHWKEDEEMKSYVEKLTEKLDKKLDMILGRIEVPLDARFSSVRSQETNVGNFVCDIILTGLDAHVAIVNSGTLRADRLIPAGDFCLRDLTNLLPMLDSMVLLQATGEQILKALENGVSQYPKLEGRFPLVAGIRFSFDPRRSPGNRIPCSSVTTQDKPLELNKTYRLAVKHYMASGKDGYDVLKECPVLVDDEEGPILSTLIQNYFRAIQVLKGFEHSRTRHRQSIVSIAEKHRLLQNSGYPEILNPDEKRQTYWQKAYQLLIEEKEAQSANAIAPGLDGRIKILS